MAKLLELCCWHNSSNLATAWINLPKFMILHDVACFKPYFAPNGVFYEVKTTVQAHCTYIHGLTSLIDIAESTVTGLYGRAELLVCLSGWYK